ncbi:MAG: isoprenylcysteine carboxylmethyltransferase family protein [Gammaproteobacteria bacterium]|nr:MAG: isoprenylcysteine carboxylmethyltransferase family protein [Gammaproteobacteria bacterium]
MNTNIDQDEKGANVKFPPPLVFIGAILLGYAMDYLLPLKIGDTIVIMIAGLMMVLIALIVIVLAILTFRRANTSVEPWRPTSAIITGGVFGISRNPIYLAFCWATIGIGLILNSWWVVLGFIPAAALITVFVIVREEAYLEDKFAEEYRRYRSRVRRWL